MTTKTHLSQRTRFSFVSLVPRASGPIKAGIMLFMSLTSVALYAQTGSAGRIVGQVQDAWTGEFMDQALVVVNETRQSAFTNEFGEFRINNVPPGEYSLTISYTGFFENNSQVVVSASATSNVGKIRIRSRNTYSSNEDVIELDSFEVRPETDAFNIAINQQRHSDAGKVVVDSGAFGDVTEGNIGEFIKFLPGISINYVAADVRSIDVRGLGANFTPVTIDGNRMASAASTSANRIFELEQVSINNVERVEVTRLPTADVPADALGGSVNLVSKSAFEREGREIKYRAYFSLNSEALSLKKTPGWDSEEDFKIWPGFDINYSDVVMDGRLGFSINYLNSNQYNEQHRSRPRWEFEEFNDAPDDGSPPQAALRRYQFQDGPKFTHRESLGIRFDYKVSEDTVVSSNLQWNDYISKFRNRNIQWDTNMDERSDARDNAVVSETMMRSRPGRGEIDYGSSWRDKFGDTWHYDFDWKRVTDNWIFDAGFFYSIATNQYRSNEKGMAKGAALEIDVPGNITFADFGDARGGNIRNAPAIAVTDENGNDIPNLGVGSLSNARLREIDIQPEDGEDEFFGFDVNAKYNFNFGETPGYFKFGAKWQSQDRYGDQARWRAEYWGPDGIENSGDEFIGSTLVDSVYSGTDGFYIGKSRGVEIAWPDNRKIDALWKAHPEYFVEDGRADDNIISAANDVYDVQETISALYSMGNVKLNDGRVTITGGLRFEKTDVDATGGKNDPNAAFRKDAQGIPLVDVDDVDGDGVVNEFIPIFTDPDDPTEPDEIESLRLAWLSERATNSASYDDIYPSLNVKWDINDKMLLRAGYAKTIGRPNFSDIMPRTVISRDEPDPSSDEPVDPSQLLGEVSINNTGLKPFESDNMDLMLEYYPQSGGQISLGFFTKDITNWITDAPGVVTQDIIRLNNLPADTLDYDFSTKANGGSADIEGFEFSYFRKLDYKFLPEWAGRFSLMANSTFLSTKGNFGNLGASEPITDLADMVKETYNLGLTYSHNPFVVQLKWNSKGRELVGRAGGDLSRNLYNAPLESLDLNFEYRMNQKMRFFLNGRNVLTDTQDRFYTNDEFGIFAFDRSEQFGIQFAIGIKGEI